MLYKTSIAALTALTLAGGAHAQSANANANAEGNAQMNYGQLVSGLQNGTEDISAWATEIEALSDDATVEIVTLSELNGEGAMNSEALDSFLSDSESELSSARMALEGNEDIAAALEAESYTADQVVAVQAGGDSSVTLVVDDRS